jgi:ATP-binding cassette subfamily B protein
MPPHGGSGFEGSMLEEDALGKAYDARLMRRLLKYLKPYKKVVIIGILLTLVVSFVEPALPLVIQSAIDGPIKQGALSKDPSFKAECSSELTMLATVFFSIIFFSLVLRYFQTLVLNYMGQSAMYDLRCELFRHLEGMGLSYYSKTPVGRLVTRVTNDIEALNELFTAGLVSVIGDIFMLLGIIVVMLVVSWKLTIIALGVGPILAIAALIFRRKAREYYRKSRIRLARINSYLQENIAGMKVIQIFLREGRNFGRFKDINADYRDVSIATIKYYALFMPAVPLLSSLATAGVLYVSGILIIGNLGITFGNFYLFWFLIGKFFDPISDLTEKYNILQAAMAASERVFAIMDTKPDVVSPADTHKPSEFHGEIEFRNVTFAYGEGPNVLENVSFKVRPGEKVAIVGATGAGKTTIVNLVMRFYDVAGGEILIDGVDVRKYDQRELRKRMGLVLQDVFLFTGTIMENIRLGAPEIPPEKVERAARYVAANTFIERLQKKYNEPVMERGATLSTGEKQLLSFARALVFEPGILILDEATSSVDPQTERLIQTGLERLMEDRTSLVIAHRLSTIKKVDRILVLHKGKVREEGTHEELIKKGGIYWKLYQLQYEKQEATI